MSQFMVGRQPIFDAKSRVHGYELLFRGPGSQRPDGDAMTADVLVHSILDVGLDALVGDKLAFVNATRAFLVGEQDLVLPPIQTVVEICEDVPRSPEVLAGCQRLAQEGYTLALDFRATPAVLALLNELDAIVADHGGRVYLAKDARTSAQMLRRFYPRLAEFQYIRNEADPNRRFTSLLSNRLDL